MLLIGLALLLCVPMAGRTEASGNVITSPDTTGDVGRSTSLALDASGNPVVSYVDYTNGALKILHCGNPDCTEDNAIATPDIFENGVQGTSLKLDSGGNPVVAYSTGYPYSLRVLHCGNPTCASGNVITTPDPTGGSIISLALDATGDPVVSYYDSGLKILHCGDATCASGNTIVVPDGSANLGGPTSLVLDDVGYPVVSYQVDSPMYDLKLLHCGSPNCTIGNSISTPDTALVGAFTSLTLNAEGNPVISYFHITTTFFVGELKILTCGDPSCTSGNTVASPDPATIMQQSSLALDSAGNPVVAYGFSFAGDLKVLHCGDPTCTAGNVIATPDSVHTGDSASLALDTQGYPVVSYYFYGDRDLKVLHCSDPACIGTKPTPTPTPQAVGGVSYDARPPTSGRETIEWVMVAIAGAAMLGATALYARRRLGR